MARLRGEVGVWGGGVMDGLKHQRMADLDMLMAESGFTTIDSLARVQWHVKWPPSLSISERLFFIRGMRERSRVIAEIGKPRPLSDRMNVGE